MDNENPAAEDVEQLATARLAFFDQPFSGLPEGDLLAKVRTLVEDHLRPRVGTMVDPVSGIQVPAIITSEGVEAVPASIFTEYLEAPRFRQGQAKLLSLDALIQHTLRFSSDDSLAFANNDRTNPSIKVVLDYHPSGAGSTPSFGKHTGYYAFPLSDEWKAWHASNGAKNAMKMGAFAEFLEDRIIDVLYLIPDEDEVSEELNKFINSCGGTIATPQKLIELSRNLQVYESCAFKEAVRLQSGEASLSFDVTHTDADGRPLIVPALFIIGIPVFKGGPLWRIAARLRYRRTNEGIVFWYDLWRTEQTFDRAFEEATERFKFETNVPLLLGTPEA